MFAHRANGTGDRRRGSVMARGGQHHVVADGLEALDRLTADRGIGDDAGQIVLRASRRMRPSKEFFCVNQAW
jgi:hypothetical protein